MQEITAGEYNLVYNAFSFTIAVMGAATVFAFLGRTQVAPHYKTALTLTGLVTLIACYHYFRIFNSWDEAYTLLNGKVTTTGIEFNDAYRYVDWLLTVPLLLLELVLVMRLPRAETIRKGTLLGGLAALMVILGYPGQVATDNTTRWIFWALAMIPFLVIVYELFVGLKDSMASQPAQVRGLVNGARWLTVIAWCFYPIVFLFPMVGLSGGLAIAGVQVGYSVADIVAKALLGVIIYMIAVGKSDAEKKAEIATTTAGAGQLLVAE
jgi:bacteriorhodopsin